MAFGAPGRQWRTKNEARADVFGQRAAEMSASRGGRVIGPLLAAIAAFWVAMLPVAAYAASQPAGSRAHAVALVVYSFGAAICHQRPERSFHLFGAPLPVCARCTGIYVGAAVAALALARAGSWVSRTTLGAKLRPKAEPRSDVSRLRVLLALAALPAAISLVYEWTTGEVPSNAARAATGFVLGSVVALVGLDFWRHPEPESLGSRPS